jgi:hypothetical protein
VGVPLPGGGWTLEPDRSNTSPDAGRVTLPRVSATALRRFHAWATLAWALAAVPTVLWWRDSVFWVAAMSLWANVASHWAAWQASRAEETIDNSSP